MTRRRDAGGHDGASSGTNRKLLHRDDKPAGQGTPGRGTPGREQKAEGARQQDEIGSRLRQLYEDVVNEPVPERLRSLLHDAPKPRRHN